VAAETEENVINLQKGQQKLEDSFARLETTIREQIRATDFHIGAVQDLFENHVRDQLSAEDFLAPLSDPVVQRLVTTHVKSGERIANGVRGGTDADASAVSGGQDVADRLAAAERLQAELDKRVSRLGEAVGKLLQKQAILEPSLSVVAKTLREVVNGANQTAAPTSTSTPTTTPG
jgi:hypothetical protein